MQRAFLSPARGHHQRIHRRRSISDVDKEGYVLADMYDPESVSVYQIWSGAKYEIRDYLITVNKTENKSLEIEVHGLLE